MALCCVVKCKKHLVLFVFLSVPTAVHNKGLGKQPRLLINSGKNISFNLIPHRTQSAECSIFSSENQVLFIYVFYISNNIIYRLIIMDFP